MAPGLRALRNLGANVLVVGRRLLGGAVLPRGPGFWLRVEVKGSLPDAPQGYALPGTAQSPGLLAVLESVERAANDPRVTGVLVRLVASPGGMAQISSLRRALLAVRAAGKPVVVWGERWGAGELLLASSATRVLMPEAGSVYLVGLGMESFFWKDLLDRLGVKPDVVRTGDFKTAAEAWTRSGMSESQREQSSALLDDAFEGLVAGIAEGRGIAPERVRELVDGGPYGAQAAAEAGLIDACCFPDEVEGALRELAGSPVAPGEEPPVPVVDVSGYHALRVRDRVFRPVMRGLPRVAYVVASGMIRPGGSRLGIASDAYRELLRRLEKDPDVRAVILRIESPGGDSLASDLLWRAVRQLAAAKPVVVSMGEVAASGGYYLAAAADLIVAEPGSVTGSIGVVGGKVSLEGALERLGIRSERIERGARAGLLSATRPFMPDERAALRGELHEIYERFVSRVAEGRGMSQAAVRAVARGRVWSGARAHELGLVDLLGGPLEALAEARRRAGLRPGEASVVDAHPRVRLGSLLGALRRPRWML